MGENNTLEDLIPKSINDEVSKIMKIMIVRHPDIYDAAKREAEKGLREKMFSDYGWRRRNNFGVCTDGINLIRLTYAYLEKDFNEIICGYKTGKTEIEKQKKESQNRLYN